MILPLAAHDAEADSDCRCAHITPLLRPVVPEVNRMSLTSSGVTAAARATTAFGVGAAGDEVVPRPVARLYRHPHDVPQRRQGVAVQVGNAIGAEESAHREQHRRMGAGQDVAGFLGGVTGVQRHHGGAGVVDRQAGHHPMPGVRRPDGHPVSGLHAERDQRGRSPVYLVAQGGGGEGRGRR